MCADLKAWLRGLTFAERLVKIPERLAQPCSESDRVNLVLGLAQALDHAGRREEAGVELALALAEPMAPEHRYRLLEAQAAMALSRGDADAVGGIIAEMDRCGVPAGCEPAYYGLRAGAMRLAADPAVALEWYRRAVDGFLTVGRTEAAAATATWAALTALDGGVDASPWLECIPVGNPYRLVIEAEMSLETVPEVAATTAELAYQRVDADQHIRGRARLVQALVCKSVNREKSLWFAEQAMTLATSKLSGVESSLIRRIKTLQDELREEVAV